MDQPTSRRRGSPGWQLDQLKTTGQDGGFDSKDAMRIHDILKKSANTDGVPDWNKVKAKSQQMANAITDYDKAHRRANAADFESLPEVGSIFRARADAIAGGKFKAQGLSTHTSGSLHQFAKDFLPTYEKGDARRFGQLVKDSLPTYTKGDWSRFRSEFLTFKRDTSSLGFRK